MATGQPLVVPLFGVRLARHPMYLNAQKTVGELELPQGLAIRFPCRLLTLSATGWPG